MGLTTYNLYPYPELTDSANVPRDQKALAQAVEASRYLPTGTTASALPTAYPVGCSTMYVSDGSTWPPAGGCVVTTSRTANSVTTQWCSTFSSNYTRLWVRNGTSTAWSGWVQIADSRGGGNVTARGRVAVTASAAVSGTAAVTFPSGLFTVGPRVVASPVGSSVWMAYMPGSSTASGVTLGIRHVDATTATATVNVDWIAVEAE